MSQDVFDITMLRAGIYAAALAFGILYPANSYGQVPAPATRVVVAEGSGLKEEDALKSAFSRAVESVVGLLIDAKTVIENDEVIAERILTFSNGYIEKYEIVSKSQSRGLITVRISAEVRVQKLSAKLNSLSFKGATTIDGASLVARAQTKGKLRGDAAAFLREAFKDFPECCLATKVGEPNVELAQKDGNVGMKIPVVVSADPEKYKVFDTNLRKVLNELARKATKYSFTPAHLNPFLDKRVMVGGGWYPDHEGFALKSGIPLFFFPRVSVHSEHYPALFPNGFFQPSPRQLEEADTIGIAAYDSWDKRKGAVAWTVFDIDKEFAPVLSEVLKRQPKLAVTMYDDGNRAVVEARNVAEIVPSVAGPKSREQSEKEPVLEGIRRYRGNNPGDTVWSSVQLLNPGLLEHIYYPVGSQKMLRVFPVAPLFYYNLWDNGAGAFSPEIRFSFPCVVNEAELAKVKRIDGAILPN